MPTLYEPILHQIIWHSCEQGKTALGFALLTKTWSLPIGGCSCDVSDREASLIIDFTAVPNSVNSENTKSAIAFIDDPVITDPKFEEASQVSTQG